MPHSVEQISFYNAADARLGVKLMISRLAWTADKV